MKILILTMTTLNFLIFFPYNGSQEIHRQTNQPFPANSPLCKHMASDPSHTPKTEENSPAEDSGSYPAPLDGLTEITGSPSEENHLEMLQADLQKFPPPGNDALHNLFTNQPSVGFAYVKGTVENPTNEDSSKSNASTSSDVIQDMSAVSSFEPNSQIRQRRISMPLSRENSISSPASVVHYHYKIDSSATPHFERDAEITHSLEHFSSIGRTKALFASDSGTHTHNSLEEFSASAEESDTDTAKEQSFLGTGITTSDEDEQEHAFFGSAAPSEKSILIPRMHSRHSIDRDMPSEGKPKLDTDVESEMEEEAVFQETEDIPSSHDLKHFESEYGNIERDGFLDSATASSLSQFIVVPSAEITVNERDLRLPEKENVDAVYVTNPTDKKMYFQPMAKKTKLNSLGESTGIKQNVETKGSIAVPVSSNSPHQIERMGYSRPLNVYYYVISQPILNTKKNPHVAWNTNNKRLSSTMDSGDIINLKDNYQTPTDINAKTNDRLANKQRTARNDVRNSTHDIAEAVNDKFHNDKDKVKIDLPSIIAAWPLKKYIIKSTDVKTLKRKPDDPGRTSQDYTKDSRDEKSRLIVDSTAPFHLSQATNSVKEISLRDILASQTYLPNKTTTTALKVGMSTGAHDAENILYSPQYEPEASLEQDATLSYETDRQNEESIKPEEEDTLEGENIKNHIAVKPTDGDYVLKETSPAGTHYSTNSAVNDATTFRRIIKHRDGQPGFEIPENVVSKPLPENFKVQGKMITTKSNHDSNSEELFRDNAYTMMEENIPNIYIFTLEAVPSFIRRDSSIRVKDNMHPGEARKSINKTNLMALLNLLNVTKKSPSAIISSPDFFAFTTKEGNYNTTTTVSTVGDTLPVSLKSLLIQNQKISRTAVSLGDSGMLSDTAVTSQVSEPTAEHLSSTEEDWEVVNEPSAVKSSQVSAAPPEDPMTFPEKIVSAAHILTTEGGDIIDETDGMALSPVAPGTATYKEGGTNKATEFVSHHVQQTSISPSAKERATSGTEACISFSTDKPVTEEKVDTFGDNVAADLGELNKMKATLFIPKLVVASAQQKGLECSKETSYPGSTLSTTKLTKAQAGDPLTVDYVKPPITNPHTKFYQLPMKMALSPTGSIENSDAKLLTTDIIILIPENITKDSGLVHDKPLTYSSGSEPKASGITEFVNLINKTDNQESQGIKRQANFRPLSVNSIVPSRTSANVFRNSINHDAGSPSSMEREHTVAEISHSQNSNIPLAGFGVASNDEFSEELDNLAMFAVSPVNAMHTMEGAFIHPTDSSHEGESMLLEEGRYKIYVAPKSPANPQFILEASTEYLETPGLLTSDLLSNSPTEWSHKFEIKDDYIHFINTISYINKINDPKSHTQNVIFLPFHFKYHST